MGGFALLLRPFDKLLAKFFDRGLEAGESFFSRETGEVSFAVSGGKKLTTPFENSMPMWNELIEAGGIFLSPNVRASLHWQAISSRHPSVGPSRRRKR